MSGHLVALICSPQPLWMAPWCSFVGGGEAMERRGGDSRPPPLHESPLPLRGAPPPRGVRERIPSHESPAHPALGDPPWGVVWKDPLHERKVTQGRGLESPLSMRGRPLATAWWKRSGEGGSVSTSNPVVPPGGRHTPCLPLTPHTTCTYSLHHPHIPHFSPYYPLAFSPHPAYTFLGFVAYL